MYSKFSKKFCSPFRAGINNIGGKKMKKVLIFALAFVMIATVFAACAQTPATPANPTSGTKITVILPEHEMDTIGFHKAKTEEFTKQTGIEVELINMGWENVAERVMADLVAGGGSFDVIEFDNAWVAKFTQNDWLEPLDDYVSPEIKAGMLPGLLNKFSMNGSLYGIAWNNDTRFYMYNKDLLEKAGITKVPETWDEVSAAAAALQSSGAAKFAYIDTYKQEQMGCNELLFVIYSFGGKLFDDKMNPIVATDPGVRAAYEYLAKAYSGKVFDPSSLTVDYEAVSNVFCMGDTALFLQAWPGVYADANNADISKIVGNIAVADYSVSKTGAEQAVLTLPEAMAIPKTSKNKEAAWEYIEFISSKSIDKERSLAIGSLPIWSELYSDADLLKLYPYWDKFGKQAMHAKGYPDIVWVDEFADTLAKVSQGILTGNVSVDDGLKQMQSLFEAAAAAQ